MMCYSLFKKRIRSTIVSKFSLEPRLRLFFRQLFEFLNDYTRESYDPGGLPDIKSLILLSSSIEYSIKTIAIDTSPGEYGVVMQTIRNLRCVRAICNISNIMRRWNFISTKYRIDKTTLIYKGSYHDSNIENWRPITIFSVLRRIIERSLH